MTRTEAILEICRDSRSEKSSRASFLRIKRACKTLALDEQETTDIFRTLEYADHTGTLYPRFVDGKAAS